MNKISINKFNYDLIKESFITTRDTNKLLENEHICIFASVYFKDGSYARTLADNYGYYDIICKYGINKSPEYNPKNIEFVDTIIDTIGKLITDTIDYKMNNILNPENNPLVSLYIYGEDNNLNRRIFNINDIATIKGTLKVTTYKNGKKDIYSTNNI